MKNKVAIFKFCAIGLLGVWLSLFVLVPNTLVLITSFLTRDADRFYSLPFNLTSYHRALDLLYLEVLWSSFKMAFFATLSCLLLAYPFAMSLAKISKKWQKIVLFLMIVPFWTNSLVRVYAVQFLLGNKGLINTFLLTLGLIEEPIALIYTPFAVVVGITYILIPFMILPLYSSFEKFDVRLTKAAKDLGAGAWSRFIHVTLPLTMPGIIAGVLMVLLPAMGMFYIADLLGGAKNLLLGNVIKTQFLNTRDWPFGASFSVLLMALMNLLLFLYYKASKFVNKKGGIQDGNF